MNGNRASCIPGPGAVEHAPLPGKQWSVELTSRAALGVEQIVAVKARRAAHLLEDLCESIDAGRIHGACKSKQKRGHIQVSTTGSAGSSRTK